LTVESSDHDFVFGPRVH